MSQTNTSDVSVLAALSVRFLAKIIDIAAIMLVCRGLYIASVVTSIWPLLGTFVLLVIVSDAIVPGRSLGKLLFRIAVASDTTFRPCARLPAIGRNFMLFALPVLDWVLVFLRDRRRVADYLFGTIVVKKSHLRLDAPIPEPISIGPDDRLFFVTIATFSNTLEAEVVRGRLEAEGIPAFVADAGLVQTHALLAAAIGWAKLQVPPEHVESAKEVLRSMKSGEYTLDE